jgi:ribosomal protein L40E
MEKNDDRKFVELEWVCPNCNGRNRGSKKTCESCGAPQPANVKFQRAADEKIVTDEKAVESARAGADIHCGFCGTRNPATAVTCSQCGGDLKEGMKRQSGETLQAAPPPLQAVTCSNCGAENPGTAKVCKQCGAPLQQPKPTPAQTPGKSAAPAKKVNWWILGGVGLMLMLCCIAAIWWFVIPSKSAKGTVTDLQWQTSVAVQEIRPVHYSDESGSPPSAAYDVSCRTDSKQVCEDKTVDQGNGYAEVVKECHDESEQYCDYTLDEWTTIQTYDMTGNDNFPTYQDPSVTSNQRAAKTVESLTVTFSSPDGMKQYTPASVSEFQQYEIGSAWTLKMNAAGSILSVEK